jgi:hypothetical protein
VAWESLIATGGSIISLTKTYCIFFTFYDTLGYGDWNRFIFGMNTSYRTCSAATNFFSLLC